MDRSPSYPEIQIYKPKGKRLKRGDLSKLTMSRLFSLLEELQARSEGIFRVFQLKWRSFSC